MLDNEFTRVFKNNLKINMRSISVKTLLGERNLKRINYKPYYQRNYVWDATKATFFIESILLGTDIPPLVLFKSGNKIEVIDGRQRFETLKRFKENSFKLTSKGLFELKVLNGKNFNELNVEVVDAFLDTKVRLFEFEVVNEPKLSDELEDKIKKEIFRRYNTGITPITSSELDNAKYDDDPLTDVIRLKFEHNPVLIKNIKNCFFSNKSNKNGITQALITDFFRRYITLTKFPISSYAGSGSRTDTRELLYDFIKSDIEDYDTFIEDFILIVNKVIEIHRLVADKAIANNKLIFECLLWGVTILNSEEKELFVDENLISKVRAHYTDSIEKYPLEDYHYYKSIFERFEDTAKFLGEIYSVDFTTYLRDENFSYRVKQLRQTEEDGVLKMNALDKLRLLKPEPISEPIEEIVCDLKSKKYMLRPSYQRQEKISIPKASSIIESILLGVYLPPIFIYKNKLGVKEVIDGQQRILSVLGFMGKRYLDEKGVENYSKNNNFSLKGLRILKDLNGSKFSNLPEQLVEKLYDFDLSIIEIDAKMNEGFNPVDLFIRLNNKPYPIKENSFEMWNSSVNNSVIKYIKEIAKEYIDWFYLRVVRKDRKNDRMENEEMIAILAYLQFQQIYGEELKSKGVEFYLKKDRLNCRFANKAAVTAFLNSLESDYNKKEQYIKSISGVKDFISKVEVLFSFKDSATSAEDFNSFFNVRGIETFKRSLQDMYLLWMIVHDISFSTINNNAGDIINDLTTLIGIMKNVDNNEINEDYMNMFLSTRDEIKSRYCQF
ncbi:hypothetical protein TUM4438_35750 [Shewanella sairae]|uniref:GmrSD restriction endonucleases N-terminal domain-containing protein n=1 Tax=Shewanella sairae TaxID=190310 RepID=A0ABQ4PPA1_9GAMM|nr:DUF262 domain-containing protein [Shewanella sairae]MCL1129744.1 DUF262 domain-containing protein [Shewanella sairae]GIU50297.1 hypothetical protein TUM4438_35750 [Shewanella sairae]